MFLENENMVNDDLDILTEIFNPVDQKTVKFEDGENRIVSILFLDVKGFTSMSEKMSSEEVKRTMDKILTAFSNSILKFGGYIDKYEGDLIMALFGSKITTETDTERAIDAGLKILSNLKEINKILDIDLAVRIGINTGEVTTGKVGMKREGDFTVYGDAVNLASRMESNAPLNSIMIPKETKDIVHDYYLFDDLGSISVKGKSKPVEVFKVLSKNPKKVERWHRNKDIIKKSSYVGRDKEMNEMITLYNKSRSEIGVVNKDYKPSIIGIRGHAGLGKSRLVKEFAERSTGSFNSILTGYTLSYAQPVYHIWTTMLKSYFKIEDDDSKITIQEKLESNYQNLIEVTGSKEALLQARNVVAYMFGVKYDDVRLENFEPEIFKDLFNVSVRYTLEAISFKTNTEEKIPLIIYFDDCQWLDEPSRNLFKTFLGSINVEEKNENRPNNSIMFILTYRPEFEILDDFNFNSNFTELKLSPLTVDYSKELINSMLGNNEISDEFINQIMDNSHGNPFYIEELISYLIENEKIIYENKTWIMPKAFDELYIPLSLNSVILSRIDNLNQNKKALLQRASVIGHHFFKTILNEVTSKIDDAEEIEPYFSHLEQDSWFFNDNDDKYLFKHILTSEICYRTILMYNKKILHRLIAETTEENFKGNIEYYSFIAKHYQKSEPEVGSSNYAKMIEYIEKSAYYSKDNYENETALELFDSLLSYDLTESKQVEILLSKVEIFELIGEWKKAETILTECLVKTNRLSDDNLTAKTYRLLGIICWKLGKTDCAMENHKKSLEYYQNVNDLKGISESYGNIGNMHYCESSNDEAMIYYQKKLKICKEINDKKGMANVLGNIGVVHWVKNEMDDAMRYFKQDLEICEDIGDKKGLSRAIGNIGLTHDEMKDSKNAMICYKKKLTVCEEIGDKQGIASALGSIGSIYEWEPNHDKAMEYYQRNLDIYEELGDKEGISIVSSNMGSIYYSKKQYEKALECFNRAIDIGRELNIKYYLCSYLYFKADTLCDMKDYEFAYRVNKEALEMSIEAQRDESIFKSKILNHKLDFFTAKDNKKKKDEVINILKELLLESDDEDVIDELTEEIKLLEKNQ